MENEKNGAKKPCKPETSSLWADSLPEMRCAWGGVTISSKGYGHSYLYLPEQKKAPHLRAKNMAVADIEPLFVNCLKNEILNGKLIKNTADAILQACKDDGVGKANAIRPEISATGKKIENLMHTLEDGLDNDMVRNRIIGHQAHLKILRDRPVAAQPAPTVTCEKLIEKLSRDRNLLLSDPLISGRRFGNVL